LAAARADAEVEMGAEGGMADAGKRIPDASTGFAAGGRVGEYIAAALSNDGGTAVEYCANGVF
jgi:hypothetical protein